MNYDFVLLRKENFGLVPEYVLRIDAATGAWREIAKSAYRNRFKLKLIDPDYESLHSKIRRCCAP